MPFISLSVDAHPEVGG